MVRQAIACVCAGLLAAACDGDTPTTPSGVGTITFQQVTPASGSTIAVSSGSPPGSFIVRGSGQLSIPMTIRGARDADWAQLYVYLLTDNSTDSYCGQNLPDAPTWGPWIGRRTVVPVTVSGFQVFRLPCDVTGVRAILHLRQGGLLTPPTGTVVLAEGSTSVVYHLRR